MNTGRTRNCVSSIFPQRTKKISVESKVNKTKLWAKKRIPLRTVLSTAGVKEPCAHCEAFNTISAADTLLRDGELGVEQIQQLEIHLPHIDRVAERGVVRFVADAEMLQEPRR